MSPVPPLYVPPPLPPELIPLDGTDWNRCIPMRSVDGDTERILRQQLTWTLDEECEIGDSLRLEEWRLRVVRDDETELDDGLAGRLVKLNTPEKGKRLPTREDGTPALPDGRAGTWAEARDDLLGWCAANAGRLRCITYDVAGGFDRLLVDLYVLAADGRSFEDSASQHMLRLGWPIYRKA